MKFIITNAQQDSINVLVSHTNMETQTIAHLLGEIYRSNERLRKYISFDTYQQLVQLSSQKEVLAPNTLLKDAFGEHVSKDSVTLTLGLTQNSDPIEGIARSDLTLVKPPVIPENLYCSISGQVFYHPVKYYYGGEKDKDGKIIRENTTCIVEKESLLNAAKTQRKCPFTRVPLSIESVEALETDIEKQQQVADFFDSYKQSGYSKRLKKEQYQETNLAISRAPQSNDPIPPTLDDQAAIERLVQGNNAQQLALLAQFQRQRKSSTTTLVVARARIARTVLEAINLNRPRNRRAQRLADYQSTTHSNSASSLPIPPFRDHYFVSEPRTRGIVINTRNYESNDNPLSTAEMHTLPLTQTNSFSGPDVNLIGTSFSGYNENSPRFNFTPSLNSSVSVSRTTETRLLVASTVASVPNIPANLTPEPAPRPPYERMP